jgi:hypothetical protein
MVRVRGGGGGGQGWLIFKEIEIVIKSKVTLRNDNAWKKRDKVFA